MLRGLPEGPRREGEPGMASSTCRRAGCSAATRDNEADLIMTESLGASTFFLLAAASSTFTTATMLSTWLPFIRRRQMTTHEADAMVDRWMAAAQESARNHGGHHSATRVRFGKV